MGKARRVGGLVRHSGQIADFGICWRRTQELKGAAQRAADRAAVGPRTGRTQPEQPQLVGFASAAWNTQLGHAIRSVLPDGEE